MAEANTEKPTEVKEQAAAAGEAAEAAPKLFKDEETGEMVSKT